MTAHCSHSTTLITATDGGHMNNYHFKMYGLDIRTFHFKRKTQMYDHRWRNNEIISWHLNGVNKSQQITTKIVGESASKGHFIISVLFDIGSLLLPAEWRLPRRYRWEFLWRRDKHKFRGNQSAFVLPHKACLEGYANLTVIRSFYFLYFL